MTLSLQFVAEIKSHLLIQHWCLAVSDLLPLALINQAASVQEIPLDYVYFSDLYKYGYKVKLIMTKQQQ
jgi:hypothetical protein